MAEVAVVAVTVEESSLIRNHDGSMPEEFTAEFFSKLASESSSPRNKRRASGGRGLTSHSMHRLMRTSSMSRLFPSKSTHHHSHPHSSFSSDGNNSWSNSLNNSSSSFGWGNESATDITMSNSLASLEENAFSAIALVEELEEVIKDQTARKDKFQDRMDSAMELACARYEGGSERPAILLALRKAHRNRTRKAYLAAARYQVIEVKNHVQGEIDRGNFDLDLASLRRHVHDILGKARVVMEDCPTPSNKELMRQLDRNLRFVEI